MWEPGVEVLLGTMSGWSQEAMDHRKTWLVRQEESLEEKESVGGYTLEGRGGKRCGVALQAVGRLELLLLGIS